MCVCVLAIRNKHIMLQYVTVLHTCTYACILFSAVCMSSIISLRVRVHASLLCIRALTHCSHARLMYGYALHHCLLHNSIIT